MKLGDCYAIKIDDIEIPPIHICTVTLWSKHADSPVVSKLCTAMLQRHRQLISRTSRPIEKANENYSQFVYQFFIFNRMNVLIAMLCNFFITLMKIKSVINDGVRFLNRIRRGVHRRALRLNSDRRKSRTVWESLPEPRPTGNPFCRTPDFIPGVNS